MSTTAQAAKIEVIERCREEAGAYVERARARSADDAAGLRIAAEADIALLQQQADGQIESLKVETEARVARRHELLQQQLGQLDPAADVEAARVHERVAAFQEELARLFEQLMQTEDPVAFADLASRMPSPPVFGAEPVDQATKSEPSAGIPSASGPVALASVASDPVAPASVASGPVAPAPVATGPAAVASASAPAAPVAAAPASGVSARVPLAPGTLSGAGAVRGRLYTEWYGEIERLREIGDEPGAVSLLLDVVAGTEAESRADGSYVAHRPYRELALIYRGHEDAEAEASILERFSRQQHAPGQATSQLLERLASIRRPVRR